MSKYVFLYRIKDSDDRDCCAYLENKPQHFECGHYFGSPNLNGSCYSGKDFADYDDIETILTRNEYERLLTFNEAIEKLGYGIKPGDERYQKGVALCQGIQDVYDKLNSKQASVFFAKIQISEKEWLVDNENLTI